MSTPLPGLLDLIHDYNPITFDDSQSLLEWLRHCDARLAWWDDMLPQPLIPQPPNILTARQKVHLMGAHMEHPRMRQWCLEGKDGNNGFLSLDFDAWLAKIEERWIGSISRRCCILGPRHDRAWCLKRLIAWGWRILAFVVAFWILSQVSTLLILGLGGGANVGGSGRVSGVSGYGGASGYAGAGGYGGYGGAGGAGGGGPGGSGGSGGAGGGTGEGGSSGSSGGLGGSGGVGGMGGLGFDVFHLIYPVAFGWGLVAPGSSGSPQLPINRMLESFGRENGTDFQVAGDLCPKRRVPGGHLCRALGAGYRRGRPHV
ncbi:hypothetical protein B0H13DRAFT_1895339 [Mycena leptocephala]|nr:hypothetical protein B0H13DRAFT_1895339 [Mycena leptocephala]